MDRNLSVTLDSPAAYDRSITSKLGERERERERERSIFTRTMGG